MAIAEASRAHQSLSPSLSVSHPLVCLHTTYSRTEVGSEVVSDLFASFPPC